MANIDWLHANETHWNDFAKDVADARRRLEALLHAGERDQFGIVACRDCGHRLLREADERNDCECPGPVSPAVHSLHRPNVCCLACRARLDDRHQRHDQGGLRDRWTCTGCPRVYDRDDYDELVARDALDNAIALPVVLLLERFAVTVGQVRMWANRGKVRRHGRDEYGRMLYDVADVAGHAEATALTG